MGKTKEGKQWGVRDGPISLEAGRSEKLTVKPEPEGGEGECVWAALFQADEQPEVGPRGPRGQL